MRAHPAAASRSSCRASTSAAATTRLGYLPCALRQLVSSNGRIGRCPAGWPNGNVRAAAGKAGNEAATCQVLLPAGRTTCARDPTQPPCWIPPLIFFGLATLFSAVILKNRRRIPSATEALEAEEVAPCPEQDPRSYQRALARSRQAAYVTKAMAYSKAGEPARAFMELARALSENSVCRSPLRDGHHTKDELVELYKLHIKYSEVPPNFATLLQMQELLGLDQDEAERIELEVLQAPGAFSI